MNFINIWGFFNQIYNIIFTLNISLPKKLLIFDDNWCQMEHAWKWWLFEVSFEVIDGRSLAAWEPLTCHWCFLGWNSWNWARGRWSQSSGIDSIRRCWKSRFGFGRAGPGRKLLAAGRSTTLSALRSEPGCGKLSRCSPKPTEPSFLGTLLE